MAPFGNARIVLSNIPFAMSFGVLHHAAKFEDLEGLAISANPFASKEDTAFRSANGDQSQDQKKGRENR
jgi:hypothetical protein